MILRFNKNPVCFTKIYLADMQLHFLKPLFRFFLAVLTGGAILLAVPPTVSSANYTEETKIILILNSYHEGYAWSDGIMVGIHSVFPGTSNTNVMVEYLDTKRHHSADYYDAFEDLLRLKYKDNPPDVLISTDDNALDFALHHRSTLFHGVPLVFNGIEKVSPERIAGQKNIFGVEENLSISATIDMALDLFPATKTVYFVTDSTITGRSYLVKALSLELEYASRATFIYMHDLSLIQLEERLHVIPEDSVVIYLIFIRDIMGQVLSLEESMKLVASQTTVPVFCTWGFQPGLGIVGGNITTGFKQGEIAAQMAQRILANNMSGIPVISQAPKVNMFDYEVLEKYGVFNIPNDSMLYNKPFSFYEAYRELTWTVTAIIASLLFISIFLFLNIQQRRKMHARMQDSMTSVVESNNAKTNFLANMSHEFRTPLNAIIGMSEALLMDGFGDDKKERRDSYLKDIHSSGGHLLELVDNILDLSLIEYGARNIRIKDVSLQTMATDTIRMMAAIAAKKDITIEIKAEEEIGTIEADRQAVMRIYLNLLSNAIKFSHNNGNITLEIFHQGDGVNVAVTDLGIGIPEEDLQRIQRPFERVDSDSAHRQGGAGLGLALVNQLISLHNGSFSIESEVGHYTKATVHFPMRQPDENSTHPH